MRSSGMTYGHGIEVELGDCEVVGMDGLDAERLQRGRGEVLAVERDNGRGAAADRRRQDVAIVRVGEDETFDQRLVAGDETIERACVHEVSGSLETFSSDLWTHAQDRLDPLVVNIRCPTCAEQTDDRQVHQEVAQSFGDQNAGVVDDGESRHDQ